MSRKQIHWINTPVLMEAMIRYEQKRLPKSMRLWIEGLLEINSTDDKGLISKSNHV